MIYNRLIELGYQQKILNRLQTMSDNIIQLNEELIKHDLFRS